MDDWDDTMFLMVFVLLQCMNRRNAVAMAVLQAAAAMPSCLSGLSSTLLHLTGAAMHSRSLADVLGSVFIRRVDGQRRMWVLERSGGVWKDLQREGGRHEKVFQRFCRLPRPLLNEILARIAPHIQHQTTNWREPVPAAQKFACALIRWATGGYYRQSAHGLGLGLASALWSNIDVADVLIREYGHLLQFPTGQKLQDSLDAFERKGFPGCVGAIDCTHVYIEKPAGQRGECFYDRTDQFSVVAQVVCDHECRIQSVFVGCPGSVHDSRVLRVSPLHREAQCGGGVFGTGGEVLRGGRTIGRYLLDDVGYPQLSWIMTPVGGNNRNAAEQVHNDCHTSARSCIERTFGRLKVVWRNFIGTQIANMKTIRKEFMAICILHNLMVEHKVQVDLELLFDDSDSDSCDVQSRRRRRRPRPQTRHAPCPPPSEEDAACAIELGNELRDCLIMHVWHHNHVHGAPPPNPWQR
ncbi:hypothetical protein CBR_g19247 [Chara braunii]|uniref:DDE Tnp4 domain-containing protein n=1 Tax=Chara braunii TaxID=69332 RepID=A0A388JTQ8_CHABU|nr:hypothetical protein CBR_g19247 [Chara braunii]|eukprot:GBG61171.1 hypothetical protein CBR_g19247 [Chara braunii]